MVGHSDLVGYAIRSLTHRGLRSWLTILGIVIGIAAIVALISVGQGLDAYIKNELVSFGSDLIMIQGTTPGGGMNPGGSFLASTRFYLTENELKEISPLPGVKEVIGLMGTRAQVEYRDGTVETAISAVDSSFFDTFDTFISYVV